MNGNVPTLGEEILRLNLYPALYEEDYYSKILTDLQFPELENLEANIDADITFLGNLFEVAVANGLEANRTGFTLSAGAANGSTYDTIEIRADIENFRIDGLEANPASLQALLELSSIAPGKVGGLFNSITFSANSVDYLTLKHSANGLSLVYENATNGMINELRIDGSFENDLNKVIPVVSDLLSFDFNDPVSLLGSQEFLDTSGNLDSLAAFSGISILQKGVAEPYLQLTVTDTTLNVSYKDWDIVGAIEVSETWQPDPDAFLAALQNLVTNSTDLDLSHLGYLYEGAGTLRLSIMQDDAGKLAEGIIHDFGELISSLDQEEGDEFIFGIDSGDSYVVDSNGLAAIVFKDREFHEIQIVDLLEILDVSLGEEEWSSSTIPSEVSEVPGVKSIGDALDDIMDGSDGDDTIASKAGDDSISAGAGHDRIAASDGHDTVDGGSGDDMIGGGLGNDSIFGGTGHDTIGSGEGNDIVDAGDGNDMVAAGRGDDIVSGGNGNDRLAGSVGEDSITGGEGEDNIGGGYNDDTIRGGSGNDTVGAGQQDDVLYGDEGDDVLNGNWGHDTIYGGDGNDTIAGGDHNDVMTGGNGADVFKFRVFNADTEDRITDFTRGEDLLEMRGSFAGLNISNHADGIQVEKNGHVIILEDVTELSADDFNFV